MSLWPVALDDDTTLTEPSAGDEVTAPPLAAVMQAVKLIEAKLGLSSSSPLKAYELGSTSDGHTDWRVKAAIDARDYGAYPTSGNDELAHLQAAIDAAAGLGGGVVRLLPGTYLTSDVLTITTSGVILEGAGMGSTFLTRTGTDASEMVYIQTPDLTSVKISGSGVRRMSINGSSHAVYGVRVTTANFIDLQQIAVSGCTTWQIYTDCWDTRPGGGDARDNQHHAFRDIYLVCTGSQGGIKLHGNSDSAINGGNGANTSLNKYENFFITIASGTGFMFGNADGNSLDFLRVLRPSGSGTGLVFGASALASGGHARNNYVFNCQAAASGVTADSNTTPSGPNFVFLNAGNGGGPTTVTVSANATLFYQTEDGKRYPYMDLPELGSAATPDSGWGRIWHGGDNRTKFVDDAGNIGLIGSSGDAPWALPFGMHLDAASVDSVALAAVSGGLGGTILVPILVPSPMHVASYTVRQSSTSLLRTAEARLYRDNGDGTFDSVSGSDATFSFTPSAISNENSGAVSGSPYIYPGVYWLAIRNTHASNSFSIRRVTVSSEAGAFRPSIVLVWNSSGHAALGSTFDISTVESKTGASQFLARVNGKVGGAAW